MVLLALMNQGCRAVLGLPSYQIALGNLGLLFLPFYQGNLGSLVIRSVPCCQELRVDR